MRLLLGLYSEEDSARFAEIAACLERNLELFPQVVVFLEDAGARALFEPFLGHSELVQLGHRLTYAEALAFPAPVDTINVLANNDIEFDTSILQLQLPALDEREFWCITRREMDGRFPPCPELTQDVWIWKSPSRVALCDANFPLGVPGCDHRIAYAAQLAGYRLRNPGVNIRLLHRHESGVRRLLPRLVGGYTYVPLDF